MKITAESTVVNDGKLNTNINNAQTTANTATTKANQAQSTANSAQTTANQAKSVADNTAQYFWFTSSGSDTGAHISEKTQAQFVANPSGGNLLARSTGIAVRDGLDELATFGADGMRIGKNNERHIEVTSSEMAVYDAGNGVPFSIATEETTRTEESIWGYIVNANATVNTTLVLKGAVENNRFYVAVGTSKPTTYTQYITNPSTSGSSITISGVTVTLTRTSENTILARRVNANSSARYVYIKATQSYYPSSIYINSRQMKPTYASLSITDTTGTTTSAYAYVYGSVAHVRLDIYNSNVANTALLYQGVLGGLLPISVAPVVGNDGYGAVIGYVYSDGTVQIRNCSGHTITKTASNPISVCGTYIVADGSY